MKLRWEIFARTLHKWLALIIGVQILIWFLSGFVMSALHMDDVHGDHLVKKTNEALVMAEILPIKDIELGSDLKEIRLKLRGANPIYVVKSAGEDRVYDAKTGLVVLPLTESEIENIASAFLVQQAKPTRVQYLDKPVQEFKGTLPVYRLDYDKPENFSLYISPKTGEMLSVRNTRWRIFDFFWMLHIMDYSERENVNTPWLRVLSFVSVIVAVTGLLLVFVWLRLSWRRRSVRSRGLKSELPYI